MHTDNIRRLYRDRRLRRTRLQGRNYLIGARYPAHRMLKIPECRLLVKFRPRIVHRIFDQNGPKIFVKRVLSSASNTHVCRDSGEQEISNIMRKQMAFEIAPDEAVVS